MEGRVQLSVVTCGKDFITLIFFGERVINNASQTSFLTYKVHPHTKRIKILTMVVDP